MRRRDLDRAGVPVVRFPVHSFRSVSVVAGALQMRRYIARNRIGLVHAFDYPAVIFGIPVARTCRSVVAVSSQRYHRALRPGWPHWCQRVTDRLADAVVVNCEYLVRHLREDEGVAADRIRLCYNGIDTRRFRPPEIPRHTSPPDPSLVIGVVCALRPEKDLGTLLTAFARVRHIRPGVRLLIAGSGPGRTELGVQAAALGIAADCTFLPAESEVARSLGSIDIFVLPSLSEALSNSLMEAMACGCCAVASATGGNVELVLDGQTGRLFQPGNASHLASVLEQLIVDDALRRDLAAGGLRLIQERFTLSACAQRMGEIYAALLPGAGTTARPA
jgi:glycosyltransferase involved in cell wall biosynthesis